MTIRVLFSHLWPFLLVASCILVSHPLHAQIQTPMQATAAPGPAYTVGAFDPKRDAEKDLRDAVVLAGESGRRVLMDVGGEWCVWCRRLDTLWARNDSLRAYRDSNYVTLKVNWSLENKNVALLSRYPKIPGYPHFFVLETDGAFLHSQDTGELEKGKGHDPEKLMAFLRAWAPAARQRQP